MFKIVGFETQNTILGTYIYKEKEKIVCACEDFTDGNHVLYEFQNLALSTCEYSREDGRFAIVAKKIK